MAFAHVVVQVGRTKTKQNKTKKSLPSQTSAGLDSSSASAASKSKAIALPEEDLPGEVEYFSGSPSTLDLVANLLLIGTILWIPLALAAIGKYAWLRYRITNKRVTIISNAPIGESQRWL